MTLAILPVISVEIFVLEDEFLQAITVGLVLE
jgi:hypothetical protein